MLKIPNPKSHTDERVAVAIHRLNEHLKTAKTVTEILEEYGATASYQASSGSDQMAYPVYLTSLDLAACLSFGDGTKEDLRRENWKVSKITNGVLAREFMVYVRTTFVQERSRRSRFGNVTRWYAAAEATEEQLKVGYILREADIDLSDL